MENKTVYSRKIGNTTWNKRYSFPVTEEVANQDKEYLENIGYEVKIAEATKGKSNNY